MFGICSGVICRSYQASVQLFTKKFDFLAS